jgi:hypothetical protein
MDVYGHLFPAERERLADALDAAHREAAAQRLHNEAGRVSSLVGGI